jgi:hypothetical protein
LRKPATILLLTVFCNSLFYYGYFSISLLKAKLAARIALAKMNPQAGSDLLKVPVFLLQKDESDEVWYQNKLYDVAERDRINDTVYVFLLRDEQEQKIISCNQNYLQDNYGPIQDGAHNLTMVKKPPVITDTEHLPSRQLALSPHDRPIIPSLLANNDALSAVCAETPTPPPRQA